MMVLYVTDLSKDSYERARCDGRFHYFVERSPSEKASDPTKKYKGPFTADGVPDSFLLPGRSS